MSGYSLFSSATIVDKQNCWQLIDKPLVRTNYRNEAHELLKAVFAQILFNLKFNSISQLGKSFNKLSYNIVVIIHSTSKY
ncbi:hypothetical protein T4A_6882 [Trichinella pseudospiralis]|uniref:Uncharacterized protein n=1 Tax=Trichinella pseudospiralis TaxID=6337 RepID=A0A0V1EZ17_TRIPS|nr:hypothetical protein T4A_6882 [Trichinella pseudospiralis]